MSHFEEMNEAELDELIERVESAIRDHLSLSVADMQRLLSALRMLVELQGELSNRSVTLHKLRKLAGLVQSSEKLTSPTESSDESRSTELNKPKPSPQPRKEPQPPVIHQTCHHQIEGLKKGDPCPECLRGKLYTYDPSVVLRISGQTPLTSTRHILERLRCNACGIYFTAPMPPEVLRDGGSEQKYGYSARALMAIYKHFAGLPFYRQQTLQQMLGLPVSASTIFDQNEVLANTLQPIFKAFIALSANAVHYHSDDTTNRILDQDTIQKPNRRTGKWTERSGIYTSGVIATLASGHAVILFQTNIGHAGEWLDEILALRDINAPPPILMSDALSRNQPTRLKAGAYYPTLCNSHARREFFDLIEFFPDQIPWILERYGRIWEHEAQCQQQKLAPAARLLYHQTHSEPIMIELKQWGESQLQSGTFESNSRFGQAVRYFLNHYEGLTGFCRIEGAQLDNNRMEAALKLIIRGRNNALFFKTLAGAAIADLLVSVIATCHEEGINPLDYLVQIQRHAEAVNAAPMQWLPWNYPQATEPI